MQDQLKELQEKYDLLLSKVEKLEKFHAEAQEITDRPTGSLRGNSFYNHVANVIRHLRNAENRTKNLR